MARRMNFWNPGPACLTYARSWSVYVPARRVLPQWPSHGRGASRLHCRGPPARPGCSSGNRAGTGAGQFRSRAEGRGKGRLEKHVRPSPAPDPDGRWRNPSRAFGDAVVNTLTGSDRPQPSSTTAQTESANKAPEATAKADKVPGANPPAYTTTSDAPKPQIVAPTAQPPATSAAASRPATDGDLGSDSVSVGADTASAAPVCDRDCRTGCRGSTCACFGQDHHSGSRRDYPQDACRCSRQRRSTGTVRDRFPLHRRPWCHG